MVLEGSLKTFLCDKFSNTYNFFSPLSFRKSFKDGRIPLGRVSGKDVPPELGVSELIRSQDEGKG